MIILVDRDGTLIKEPQKSEQVNGLEQLEIVDFSISSLKRFTKCGAEIWMVTNQDGLGTKDNPVKNFELINQKLFQIFESEKITFSKILVCPHNRHTHCDCRKPKINLVQPYLNELLATESYMIGDRETDMEFAKNIGIKGFLLSEKQNWVSIAEQILDAPRTASVKRATKETRISIQLNLDGKGKSNINTGVKFFDHMLEQVSKHGSFDLNIHCEGDLEIDEHHTIEDVAIVLGQCFKKALGNSYGIERFANESVIVMDECKTDIALDISGRPYLIFKANFKREKIGDFPTEMLEHFYYSLIQNGGITLHLSLAGQNEHHKIESSFKALGISLRKAVKKTKKFTPSTKGIL